MRSSESAKSAVMAIWLASCRYAGVTTNGSSVPAQKTSSGQRQRARAEKAASAPAKQARRTPHQQSDHHEVDEEGSEPGNVILASHVANAEQRRGKERAADRAEPAHRHHDEHVHEIGEREDVVEPHHFHGERAAEAGEAAA